MPTSRLDAAYAASDDEVGEALGAAADGKRLSDRDRANLARRLYDDVRGAWDARQAFRDEAFESFLFLRSRQWEARVPRRTITERELLLEQGRVPLVMNVMASIVANVEGQFRQNKSGREAFAVDRADEEAVRMMNLARRAMRRRNRSHVIEADGFRDHLLGGASAFKSSLEFDPILRRYEVTDAPVDQYRLFYNLDITDRRFRGLRLIGELHDVTFDQLTSKLARSRRDADRLKHLYATTPGGSERSFGYDADYDGRGLVDFHATSRVGDCRVIEAWRPVYRWVRMALDPAFETLPEGYGELALDEAAFTREQNRRRDFGIPLLEADEPQYLPYWHVYYLGPGGVLLYDQPTPYLHGEHPYAPGLAMLSHGETWGLLSPVKDPQKWLNRLLVGIDHAMMSSSKGALAYDKAFIEGTELAREDVEAWHTSPTGTLELAVPQGKRLQDFTHTHRAEALPAGYYEMVGTLSAFIERVSGVSSAMQGQAPKAGTAAALYQQQIMQGATNVVGYLQTYFETLQEKDRKELMLIQQGFTEERSFAGDLGGTALTFDPARVAAMDYDVTLGDVAETAIYQQVSEEMLRADVDAGRLPYEVYLDITALPGAQAIKGRLAAFKAEQMQQAAMMDPAAMGAPTGEGAPGAPPRPPVAAAAPGAATAPPLL